MIIPNIRENKKCSKPPTSRCFTHQDPIAYCLPICQRCFSPIQHNPHVRLFNQDPIETLGSPIAMLDDQRGVNFCSRKMMAAATLAEHKNQRAPRSAHGPEAISPMISHCSEASCSACLRWARRPAGKAADPMEKTLKNPSRLFPKMLEEHENIIGLVYREQKKQDRLLNLNGKKKRRT